MARARNIKPGFFKNEELLDLPMDGRLLFIGLWMLADREGRLEDKPKQIKYEIFPGDAVDVNARLQELHDAGLIVRYEVGGERFIEVLNFTKHQTPHIKEKASTIPAPDKHQTKPVLAPPDVLNPESGCSDVLIPDSLNPEPGLSDSPSKPVCAGAKAPSPAKKPVPTADTWTAYAAAYRDRYGVEPVRNATVNGQLANFVKRIGAYEAPLVAAWYVRSNTQYRIRCKHSVGGMLQDAEGLRTEWATGSTVTATQAMQGDRTQSLGNVFMKLIAEAESVEKAA